MEIKSYILYFEENQKELVISQLSSLPQCEIIPAQNFDVIVLVTEAKDSESDQELYNKILKIKGLKHLSLVSGFDAQ